MKRIKEINTAKIKSNFQQRKKLSNAIKNNVKQILYLLWQLTTDTKAIT